MAHTLFLCMIGYVCLNVFDTYFKKNTEMF